MTSPSRLPHDLEIETRAREVIEHPHSVDSSVLRSARRVIERNAQWRYEQALDDAAREAELRLFLAPLIEMGGYRHDG